jgi:hypothetical protein
LEDETKLLSYRVDSSFTENPNLGLRAQVVGLKSETIATGIDRIVVLFFIHAKGAWLEKQRKLFLKHGTLFAVVEIGYTPTSLPNACKST